jgi:hypothetical protein
MRIVQTHSHLNGLEFMMVRKPGLWAEIQSVIGGVDASKFRTKVSREQRMLGKALYAPKELNAAVGTAFAGHEWKESRTSYWVTSDAQLIRKTMNLAPNEQKRAIETAGGEAIFSYNQADFVKDRVAVEVQFGKYAFVAFDLFVKHMAFYVGDVIDLGVEVLPMKELQREMSSGPGYYEGELYNLVRQGRGNPPVPLVLVGVAP